MVTFIIFVWLILLSIVSLINLSLLISLWRKFNNFSISIDSSIEDQSNTLLARFQKITSSRLRALDNKIEILDQLIKDADEAYMKSFSMLTDLEKKNDELKRIKTVERAKKEKARFSSVDSEKVEIPEVKTQEEKIKANEYYKFQNVYKNNTNEEIKKESQKSPEQILKEKIIEYYNNGKSINEIAKMLDKGSGEVKLIIDLYYKNSH
jgi:vacuolar-type H+-ATPase subunit I/STV1